MIKTVVSVLGTDYEIVIDAPESDLPENSDGCMDHSTKKILIRDFSEDKDHIADLDVYRKRVIRHELTHAFLYESGLWADSEIKEGWGCSEEITDWIAIQAPKLFEAFSKAGAL